VRHLLYLLPPIGVLSLLSLCGAQDMPALDPEAMKLLQQVQEQNQSIPAEILALMPEGLGVTEKSWVVEPTTNSLLQLDLRSEELRILLTSYNLKSMVGKLTADQSLELQRKDAREEWLRLNPKRQEDYREFSEPEKVDVPNGKLYVQKLLCKAHHEGEGQVPESVSYTGFLYLEVTNGVLKAEISGMRDSRADVEEWLRHVADNASKLKLETYFE
jgi:hypothetical protein